MTDDYPDNLFVAGFIGSPAMNFFPAKIKKDDGKLLVDSEAFSLEIPANKNEVYSLHVNKEVIFGIRPEDIHNPDFAPPGITAHPVEAKVDVTELMGNEIFVYLTSGEHTYIARVDPRTRVHMGDDMQVVFNLDNMHIFDIESEDAVR